MPHSRAEIAKVAKRRTEAIELRAAGQPWAKIADALGYKTGAAACQDVGRALQQRLEEQALAADHLREIELERLDALEREVWTVLHRRHVTVSGGKIVRDDGEPLQDDGPTLAAVDRLLKIQERRAKLLGLDSPVKVDAATTVRYEIVGVDLGALHAGNGQHVGNGHS